MVKISTDACTISHNGLDECTFLYTGIKGNSATYIVESEINNIIDALIAYQLARKTNAG